MLTQLILPNLISSKCGLIILSLCTFSASRVDYGRLWNIKCFFRFYFLGKKNLLLIDSCLNDFLVFFYFANDMRFFFGSFVKDIENSVQICLKMSQFILPFYFGLKYLKKPFRWWPSFCLLNKGIKLMLFYFLHQPLYGFQLKSRSWIFKWRKFHCSS